MLSRRSQLRIARVLVGVGALVLTACPPPPPRVSVVSVSVAPSSVTLTGIGVTQAVTATALDKRGLPVAGASLNWSSSNPAVATVTGSGSSATITSTGAGQAVLQVQSGNASASIVVAVVANLRSVNASASTVTLDFGSARNRELTASADADPGVVPTYTWTTTNAGVVTVAPATGATTTLTAIGAGAATVSLRGTGPAGVVRTADVVVTVLPGQVRGVALTPRTPSVDVGSTLQMSVAVTADPGLSTAVAWSSSNPGVATVSNTGLVSGITHGTATLRVESVVSPAIRDSVTVNVVGRVTGLSVTPATGSVAIGGALQLTANITADPGVSRALVWTTRTPGVATVSATGVVTGVSVGTVSILATSAVTPAVRDSAVVTVSGNVQSVTVSPRTGTLPIGATLQLTASVARDSGVAAGVSWTTSNAAVATVSSNGLVAAVGAGAVTVYAASVARPQVRDSALLTVAGIVRSVSVTPQSGTIASGSTLQLSASVLADPGVSTSVAWTSSATSVATVNGSGLVTGVAAGTAKVYAASVIDPQRRDSATVTVQSAVRSVTVTPRTATVSPGTTANLTATVVADPGVSTAVSWATSNAAVATVSSSGVVSAVAPGQAWIVGASTVNALKRDSAAVTVALLGQWMGRHSNNDVQQSGSRVYLASADFSLAQGQMNNTACGNAGSISAVTATQITVTYQGCVVEVMQYRLTTDSLIMSGTATAQSGGRTYASQYIFTRRQPRFSDSFNGTLANWVVRDPDALSSWTTQSGEVIGDYDIGCGSSNCHQGILLLSDALQPGATNWRADINTNLVQQYTGFNGGAIGSYGKFALWVSDNEKEQMAAGYGWQGTVAPATSSLINVGHQRYPWTLVGDLPNLSVATWTTTAWQRVTLEKIGNTYTLFFNGVQVYTTTRTFTAPPKIGLATYGKSREDNFSLYLR